MSDLTASMLWPMHSGPLENITAFDRLAGEAMDPEQIARLNAWIAPQATCDEIIKHHGAAGLRRVIRGIALASAKLHVPMTSRVASVAPFYGAEPT